MRVVVTGGAGFIGSNVVDALLAAGHDTVSLDNYTTGRRRNLEPASTSERFTALECDVYLEPDRLAAIFEGADAVVHLAANADVRFGWRTPRKDLEQNVIATHNVLEAMRATAVSRLLFSSTGSVYGEAAVIPTPEDAPFPEQTSLYGASKLAAEGYIAAYAEGAGISATVFRFVSLMGHRYSHGHVIDFVTQLLRDETRLTVLGDGSQRKSYLDVADCTAAVLLRLPASPAYEVLNLGVEGFCTVRDSVGWICERMGVEPVVHYGTEDRGWVGDNPFISLDTSRMRALGWAATRTIREAIEGTVDDLLERSHELLEVAPALDDRDES